MREKLPPRLRMIIQINLIPSDSVFVCPLMATEATQEQQKLDATNLGAEENKEGTDAKDDGDGNNTVPTEMFAMEAQKNTYEKMDQDKFLGWYKDSLRGDVMASVAQVLCKYFPLRYFRCLPWHRTQDDDWTQLLRAAWLN